MAGSDIRHVTGATWQSEVADSPVPVLVDFWAEWCGPCRAVAPVLDQLNSELAGRLQIVKVNVDENPELADKFRIRSIPSLLLLKGGQVVASMVGAKSKADISAQLASHLG